MPTPTIDFQLIVLTKTGRSGSLFFQHLVDQHPQVIALPYIFNFYYCWNTLPKNVGEKTENIVEHLLEKTALREIFQRDSEAYNLIIDKSAKESLIIPKKIEMKSEILKLLPEYSPGRKALLTAVHLAYAKILGISLEGKTHIFLHEHNGYHYDQMNEDFPGFRLVVLMRDPRASYLSFVQSYLQLKTPIRSLVFELNSIYSEINNETFERFHPEQFLSVKIEDINASPEVGMRKFCEFSGIAFNSGVLQATCMGHSTSINSSRAAGLTGFNNNKIKESIWAKKCSKREIFLVESVHTNLMKAYRETNSPGGDSSFIAFLLFVLLPDVKAFFFHNPTLKNKFEYVRRKYWVYFRKEWVRLYRISRTSSQSTEVYVKR